MIVFYEATKMSGSAACRSSRVNCDKGPSRESSDIPSLQSAGALENVMFQS